MTRINPGGNFCGHDPLQPRLELIKPARTGKGGHPPLILATMARLKDFYHNPTLLPALNAANGSARQTRSERRESEVLLAQSLLKHMDQATLRVGVPTPRGFQSLPMAYFERETGLSESRAKRALRDLRWAGVVTLTTIRERLTDGSWKSRAAIKTISPRLFEWLGMGKALMRERKKARKRLAERQQAENTSTRLGTLMTKLNPIPSVSRRRRRANNDIERDRQLQVKAAELKAAHWDWDREQCYREAEKLIKTFHY